MSEITATSTLKILDRLDNIFVAKINADSESLHYSHIKIDDRQLIFALELAPETVNYVREFLKHYKVDVLEFLIADFTDEPIIWADGLPSTDPDQGKYSRTFVEACIAFSMAIERSNQGLATLFINTTGGMSCMAIEETEEERTGAEERKEKEVQDSEACDA
ncbi:hypothetical protein CL633_00590 [bacterium]|nr:hypothetical protein [bacterium]|tara:strand:- start:29720 stop:30205 length:486 start_codon:yes stop_codon:yes gene_type:complete